MKKYLFVYMEKEGSICNDYWDMEKGETKESVIKEITKDKGDITILNIIEI